MGQHTDLAAMMGVVRNHVCHHGSVGLPWSRPTVAVKDLGLGDHLAATRATLSQSGLRLLLRTSKAVKLRWDLHMRDGQPQPFATHVVDVGHDGRDCSPLTPRQLSAPRSGIQILQQELIHPLVDCVALHQHPARIIAHVTAPLWPPGRLPPTSTAR